MAGPYGRMCRDLFGQSLHIKGYLVLNEKAKLTVPNATIGCIEVTGNIVTSGITEQEGLQGIRIIGNLCMDETFALKTGIIKETVLDQGVAIKRAALYDKFGFGRVYLSVDQQLDKNGNTEQIIFQGNSQSVYTTFDGLVNPGNDPSKSFVAPTTSTLAVPFGCTFGNVVVDTKLQLQANIFSGVAGDTITVLLVKNGNTSDPLVESIHTLAIATASNTIQTIVLTDMVTVDPGDQLDFYIETGNISGNLCVGLNSGSSRSFASFNILSLEQ